VEITLRHFTDTVEDKTEGIARTQSTEMLPFNKRDNHSSQAAHMRLLRSLIRFPKLDREGIQAVPLHAMEAVGGEEV
jgi:hypothetical protein